MSKKLGNESRVKKTLLNARVNLIFYILTLVLSFFSRKVFLDCLGADFVGLTGTLQNLLGFLNLAELGIGAAIGFVLYKPIFDQDQQKINEIISVMGYLYRWIGLIILGSGIILSFFLPLIFPDSDTGFHLPLIYFAYYSFLASSLIGYFINYRQNLLGADQRNYVVTGYFQTMNIIKTIIQMVLAYYTGSFYLWLSIELIFGIVYSFILNWKINQTYPWLKSDIALGKKVLKKYPEVMKKTKQLFIHQINGFAQFQTTPFLTYAFVSIQMVAYLGNYTLIIDKMTTMMNTVLGSTSAGVGNLIAEGNKTKIVNTFWKITCIRSFCALVITFISYISFDSFISAWIGSEYILPKYILMLLLIKIYTQLVTGGIGQFIYGYGLFGDVWASVAQTVIFLCGAIIGGYYWGLTGILLAAFISIFIIAGIWKPIYLFWKGFKISQINYWMGFIKFLIVNSLLIAGGIKFLDWINFNYSNSMSIWFLQTVIILFCYSIISALVYFIIFKETKDILLLLKTTRNR